MYGIVNSDVNRNQAGRSWVSKALVYSFASALAGGAAGTLLGAAGEHLPGDIRLACASLLAILAAILGGWELGGRRLRPLQCDRETPQRWMHAGALRWALRNGSALGLGMTSRIGFWLWYVVPATAVLGGQPTLGLAVYGGYGLARGAAVWALLWLSRHTGDTPLGGQVLLDYAVAYAPTARVLAAGQLVVVGIAVALTIGI